MKASKLTRGLMLAFVAVLCSLDLSANNIRIIGTPQVDKKNDSIAAITFTIAWDNSWRASKPANYDAAWIYVKCWDGDQWNHAYLQEKGHTPGNKEASGYNVNNRDKSKSKLPMTIDCGYSMVYKKWHVNPDEKPVKGVVGVFLYRKDSLGAGDVVVPGVSLLWNYADQGFVQDDDLVVKVFAVEMVYVPKGAFYLGGKGNAGIQTYAFTTNGTTYGRPYYVKSENAITLANNALDSTLWGISTFFAGTLPAKFPKGYNAFYIMKYELTQEAYCDFLNTLNQGQQDGRINGTLAGIGVGGSAWNGAVNVYAHHRYYLEVSKRAPTVVFGVDGNNNNKWNETKLITRKNGNKIDTCEIGIDGQDLAMHFISFYDLLAYADFAGLRPMTELEYEKACRGDRPVVNDEFAWGSSTYTAGMIGYHNSSGNYFSWTDTLTNMMYINTGMEKPRGDFNCGAARGTASAGGYNGSNGWPLWTYAAPLRVGSFADSTTTRPAAGATYWGVMNMSDNVAELCVSVGYNTAANAMGRQFQGVHGDGQLQANGNADVAGWNIVDNAYFYIPRGMIFTYGGSWIWDKQGNMGYVPWGQNYEAGRVASRAGVTCVVAPSARQTSWMHGIRCVRTADATE